MNIYQAEAFTRFAAKVNVLGLGSYVDTTNLVALFDAAQPLPSTNLPVYVAGDIDEHLRNGKLILAIRAYKDHTGVGLKASKDAVEAIRDADPVRYPRPSRI